MTESGRGRLAFLGLLILFAGPILGAYALNIFMPGWLPFGTTNHGELLRPPISLADADFQPLGSADQGPVPLKGVWTLAYVSHSGCKSVCQLALIDLRQVKIALGRDTNRFRQLLVLTNPQSAVPAFLKGDSGLRIARSAASHLPANVVGGDYLLLVDPQGFAVMHYPPATSPSAVLKDLKRLLKISKIG